MARAHLYNGLTEIQQGYVDVGRKEVQEAVKLDPNNVRARLVLGEVYLNVERAGGGGEGGARGAAPEPVQRAGGASCSPIRSWRGRSGRRPSRSTQAMIKQMPKNPVGYLKMGLSRKFQDKPTEAAGFFAQAVERNPKDLTSVNEYIFALAGGEGAGQGEKGPGRDVAKEPKNPLLWEMAGRFQLATREAGGSGERRS